MGNCPLPHSPAVAFPLSGMRGTFSGLSHFRRRRFRFCWDSRRRRGRTVGIPVVSSQHPWGSFFLASATHPLPREAGWLLPLFRLAFVVAEAKEKKLFLGNSPLFCQRVLKLRGELRLQGTSRGNPWQLVARNSALPSEAGRDWPPKTTPPSWAWPRAGAWELQVTRPGAASLLLLLTSPWFFSLGSVSSWASC